MFLKLTIVKKWGDNKMKKFLSLFMIVVVLTTLSTSVLADKFSTKDSKVVEGELIVSIEKPVGKYSIQSFDNQVEKHINTLNETGFEVKDSLLSSVFDGEVTISSKNNDFISEVIEEVGYVYLVKYEDTGESIEKVIQRLEDKLTEKGLKVKLIEPNYVVKMDGQIDSLQDFRSIRTEKIHEDQAWHYEMINIPKAWEISSGNRNVKMAVLDTGIDYNHKNLKNYVNKSLGKNFTSNDTSDFMDRQGHGTHVAGTIASYGEISGVMQEATLVPVKVLGDNGSGSTYNIMQGLIHATNEDVDVVNMSIRGWNYSEGMDNACRTAESRGVIVVAATGNDSMSQIGYPARYDSVLSVGAVDSSGRRASFSNYGEGGVGVMAPGVDIYSTFLNNKYMYMSGTSMATPHVAGVAGLIKSVNRNISASKAKEIIKNTANYAGDQYEYGSGIVDAYKALEAVSGH